MDEMYGLYKTEKHSPSGPDRGPGGVAADSASEGRGPRRGLTVLRTDS